MEQVTCFDHVFYKKVNLDLLFNPLGAKDFSKIRQNSVFYINFQMVVKWPKMTLESSVKKENVANFILFNLSVPEF